jgi:hypothetical protein
MKATKILWGQVLLVLFIVLATTWWRNPMDGLAAGLSA